MTALVKRRELLAFEAALESAAYDKISSPVNRTTRTDEPADVGMDSLLSMGRVGRHSKLLSGRSTCQYRERCASSQRLRFDDTSAASLVRAQRARYAVGMQTAVSR